MADKLSRIIRESESSQSETTKNIIQEIKQQLVEISKTEPLAQGSPSAHGKPSAHKKKKPNLPLSWKPTLELSFCLKESSLLNPKKTLSIITNPNGRRRHNSSNHLSKLFSLPNIDKELLRKRIKDILKEKSQTTLFEVVENYGGLEKGLSELFGYIGIAREFKHLINPDKTQNVVFDDKNKKQIKIPEIILTQ